MMCQFSKTVSLVCRGYLLILHSSRCLLFNVFKEWVISGWNQWKWRTANSTNVSNAWYESRRKWWKTLLVEMHVQKSNFLSSLWQNCFCPRKRSKLTGSVIDMKWMNVIMTWRYRKVINKEHLKRGCSTWWRESCSWKRNKIWTIGGPNRISLQKMYDEHSYWLCKRSWKIKNINGLFWNTRSSIDT